MARTGSFRRRSRGLFWDTADKLTVLGLQIGGAAFAVVSVYLLWGIFTGSMSRAGALGGEDLRRILENIQIACNILVFSGVAMVVCGSVRFYLDEETGYVLMCAGTTLRWGMPVLVGSTIQTLTIQTASLPAYVAAQYTFVGTVSLIAAAPFLILDFWRKARGAKRRAKRGALLVTKADDEEQLPKSRLCVFCWQMPYCRDYLRKFCQAYERRKSCWRIKSGCYCDEDMILRVMKRSTTSKVEGFDQRYAWLEGGGKGKQIGAAQKRQRCRECFIFTEHQKIKYRVMSPLTFPLTAALMWIYFRPLKSLLHNALQLTDKFAGRLSYLPKTHELNPLTAGWSDSATASNTVEWLFLCCLALVLVTYLLRGLEYFIFDLNV